MRLDDMTSVELYNWQIERGWTPSPERIGDERAQVEDVIAQLNEGGVENRMRALTIARLAARAGLVIKQTI